MVEGREKIVMLLLEHDADPTVQGPRGFLIAQLLTIGRTAQVQMLFDRGIELKIQCQESLLCTATSGGAASLRFLFPA